MGTLFGVGVICGCWRFVGGDVVINGGVGYVVSSLWAVMVDVVVVSCWMVIFVVVVVSGETCDVMLEKIMVMLCSVLLSPPQIPAGLKGFLRNPAGPHYNFGDFELEEKHSVKSSGILRTT